MEHRDKVIIEKIIKEIDTGFEMLEDSTEEEFLSSKLLMHAIAMCEINIGELVKPVTDPLKKAHPEVKWKEITGMRDIAAHKYGSINFKRVYDTIHDDFSVLKTQLQSILGSES